MSQPLDSVWPLAARLGFSRAGFEAALEPLLVEGETLELEGLTLAAACLARLAPALRELDEALLPDVRATLLRRAGAAQVDDVLQQTRVKLLLAERPALSQYRGRGPLQGFVRTVAVNLLANVLERTRPTEGDEALATLPDTAELEAGVLRADQQQHFKEAFRAAVASLTPRQRALLRLSLVDGLTLDEIAPIHGMHRSSVARWLAEARERLAEQTRLELGSRLCLEGEALESLLRSVQARFDLSLMSALRE